MLRLANRSSFSHVGAVKERWLWLGACFVSPFASKASSHHDSHVKLSPSKVSNSKSNSNYGDASVVRRQHAQGGDAEISVCNDASVVRRQHAHGYFRARGDAVCNAGREDVDVQFCNGDVIGLACSHHDAKGRSVIGDTKSAACMPYAKTHFSNVDERVTESMAYTNDDTVLASSSKFNNKGLSSEAAASKTVSSNDVTILASSSNLCLPSDVSNETLSPHESLQTLVIQTQKKARKELPDLQQKVELLEAERFSLSDATMLVKRKAFKLCSYEQLATMIQVLKLLFPSAKLVHDILVRSSTVLVQPAELVQQKLKLLYDFQVDEKVVCKLCGAGKVLSLSVELLLKRLMFYNEIGLSVAARNKMFSKGPLILLLSIKNNIHPALNFLESIGLSKECSLKLGQRCPEIFYMSLDNNLIKRYEYFKNLGFPATAFPRVFRYVCRLSIKNIEERIQFLKHVGFTDDDVFVMLKKQPAVLALSHDNVKSKMNFLICEQNRDMAEIVNHPSSLMYSLQNRIVPRLNFVKELGDSEVYPLSSILDVTDYKFTKWFEKMKGKQLFAVG